MHATPLDTHKAVNQLKASGIEEKQAEAIVKLISNVMSDQIATKQDLDILHGNINSDFNDMKLDSKILDKNIDWIKKILFTIGAAFFIAVLFHN